LGEDSCRWADGYVCGDGSSGPDSWNSCVLAGDWDWDDGGCCSTTGWLDTGDAGDGLGQGAWAVGDGQGGRLADGVGLGALDEGGCGWADSSEDVGGDGGVDNGLRRSGVGVDTSLSGSNEPGGDEERLEGLHSDCGFFFL